VLVHEGGYSNHPADPGGATMKGVTQPVFTEWLAADGKPSRDVRTITSTEVAAIYRKRFWDIAKLDILAPGVSYVVFDGNVNSGVSQSIKWLQGALQALGSIRARLTASSGRGRSWRRPA
jgi:lysozyme family protein